MTEKAVTVKFLQKNSNVFRMGAMYECDKQRDGPLFFLHQAEYRTDLYGVSGEQADRNR